MKRSDANSMEAPRFRISPRRGLRAPEAALYIGVSVGKFNELVKERKMPEAIKVDNCAIWDIRALDSAFDALQESV